MSNKEDKNNNDDDYALSENNFNYCINKNYKKCNSYNKNNDFMKLLGVKQNNHENINSNFNKETISNDNKDLSINNREMNYFYIEYYNKILSILIYSNFLIIYKKYTF